MENAGGKGEEEGASPLAVLAGFWREEGKKVVTFLLPPKRNKYKGGEQGA